MVVFTETGDQIQLGAQIGVGGEAAVLAVERDPRLLAKVYHQHRLTKDRQAKVECMIRNAPADPAAHTGTISIAWPRDLLYSDRNRTHFVGFTMPRVENCQPVYRLYFPKDRKSIWPLFNWKYLLYAARNVASSLAALHQRGYVVGDLNESNLLVRDTAQIVFIDTDSFQVTTPAYVHRCVVGKKEYTPPENQGRDLTSFDRRDDHDCFALAVLVFQLLMEGRHPFDGVAAHPSVPEAHEHSERIIVNYFRLAYAANGEVRPPLDCPDFQMLPDAIRQLFMRCFVDGETIPSSRPRAVEWMSVLDAVGATLVTCPQSQQHHYSPHLQECPWCERMRRLNLADPFPIAVPAAATTGQSPTATLTTQASPAPMQGSVSVAPASTAAHRSSAAPRQAAPSGAQAAPPRTASVARSPGPLRAAAVRRSVAPPQGIAAPPAVATARPPGGRPAPGSVMVTQLALPGQSAVLPGGAGAKAATGAVRPGTSALLPAPPAVPTVAGAPTAPSAAFGLGGLPSAAFGLAGSAPPVPSGAALLPPSPHLTSVPLPPVSAAPPGSGAQSATTTGHGRSP